MPDTDFTLEQAETQLGLSVTVSRFLSSELSVTVPDWLPGQLARGLRLALLSEKARGEFLVAPVLLAAREVSNDRLSILSGHRLDVDAERGLTGECDFLLTLDVPVPRLRAPVAVIVEAKRDDIEGGLGQCIAQMVAARVFNERAGRPLPSVAGCVTTGERWQFLRLHGTQVSLEPTQLYIDDIAGVLAAFAAVTASALSPATTAA